MPSHLSSIPSSISCRAPVFFFFNATKLCGPEKDLAQKQIFEQIHAWTHLHPFVLLLAFSLWRGGGGGALPAQPGSAQLSTQKHKAAIFRCQAQICDLNPRCGGFTAAGVCSQRTALMFGPTTQPVGSGPPPPPPPPPPPSPQLLLGIPACGLVAVYISV